MTFFRTSLLNLRGLAPLALTCALVVSGIACGGDAGADSGAEASGAGDSAVSSKSASTNSGGVQAAKAVGTIDTQYFTVSLPEGWEVMADDIDRMGLMTLSKKGTGGSQGVYLKFEQGFSGDPMAAIEKFATKYKGTPAESVSRNGVDWARTRYSYNGIEQSLNITAQNGRKVTFTVMGDDYGQSPAVKTIFDSVTFK